MPQRNMVKKPQKIIYHAGNINLFSLQAQEINALQKTTLVYLFALTAQGEESFADKQRNCGNRQ